MADGDFLFPEDCDLMTTPAILSDATSWNSIPVSFIVAANGYFG
jgi:hypothetical protein